MWDWSKRTQVIASTLRLVAWNCGSVWPAGLYKQLTTIILNITRFVRTTITCLLLQPPQADSVSTSRTTDSRQTTALKERGFLQAKWVMWSKTYITILSAILGHVFKLARVARECRATLQKKAFFNAFLSRLPLKKQGTVRKLAGDLLITQIQLLRIFLILAQTLSGWK